MSYSRQRQALSDTKVTLMDTDDIIKATQSTKRLIQDDNYYKYIFKKTERIVSVVFYISHTIKDTSHDTLQVEELETAARRLHDAVLKSLSARAHVADELVRETAHALVVLVSKLSVAQMSNVVTAEVFAVINNEADSVLRALTPYVGEEVKIFEAVGSSAPSKRIISTPLPKRSNLQPEGSTPVPPSAASSNTNRQAQIKAIIETQGEVSIKDVSTIITDISEKTIQRELNDMIENNQIKRIGERRWSKYVLF